MDKPKVILAHPGRQHSFRVAKALKEAGLLYKYVTTVYDKEGEPLIVSVQVLTTKMSCSLSLSSHTFSCSYTDLIRNNILHVGSMISYQSDSK